VPLAAGDENRNVPICGPEVDFVVSADVVDRERPRERPGRHRA
jgi:hypothetical protein